MSKSVLFLNLKLPVDPQKRDLFRGGFFSLKMGSGILGRSQTVFIYKEYIHPKYSNRQAQWSKE